MSMAFSSPEGNVFIVQGLKPVYISISEAYQSMKRFGDVKVDKDPRIRRISTLEGILFYPDKGPECVSNTFHNF
jgi:hypothetical protein